MAYKMPPMRPTRQDVAANELETEVMDKLVVGAFMEGGPYELAEPTIKMKRPRCLKCNAALITAIQRTSDVYPYDDFHVGWYCPQCEAYVGSESENLLGWTIIALADKDPVVVSAPEYEKGSGT